MKLPRSRVLIPISVALIAIPALQYVFNQKYSFPEPRPFMGSSLYNPYQHLDTSKWRVANFHAHTRCYAGLTNGASNLDKSLDTCYRYLNYDIIGISNYQSIDRYESLNKWFIPVYEHGYQYYKNHQLVINARKVSWLDYVFRQTLSNKQTVINRLKKDKSAIVTLVHPVKRRAYSFKDLKYLGNYDCLEIADNERVFTSYYDTILSAGHPVFLMANDDTHDLSKPGDMCHSFNVINSDLNRDSILHAIKTGCLFGVDLIGNSNNSLQEKRNEIHKLPEIKSVVVKNETLSICLSKPVRTIKFIGQNGILKKRIINSATGSYAFTPQDTYIRSEIECPDGTLFYLNPVFRYNGSLSSVRLPVKDRFTTWGSVTFLSIVLLFPFTRLIRRRYNSKSKVMIELSPDSNIST